MTLGPLFTVRPPYPAPFSMEERLAIEEAVREGLKRAFTRDVGLQQAPLQEVAITTALERELASMMVDPSEPVEGFTCQVFETPVRGGELHDWTGTPIASEKRPDLVLRSKTRPRAGMDPRHFGLFIECKVVDRSRVMHPYVRDGLARFVDGTYAWAVPIALMVAYVQGPYVLPGTLQKYLSSDPSTSPLNTTVSLRALPSAANVYTSIHARSFLLDSTSPGPIAVDHLWYVVPPIAGSPTPTPSTVEPTT